METNPEDIGKAITIGSLALVILAVFTLMFTMLFAKKKRGLQEKNLQLQADYAEALLRAQLEIQEQTLSHISREIHDNIGQVLSLVSLNLHTLTAHDSEKVSSTATLVTKAIQDLRHLSKSMNSDRMQQIGLVEAIQQDFQQLERTGRFRTFFEIDRNLPDLSPDQTIILYRMTQEVLNNIIKHAEADQVHIHLDGETIKITDNGKGFDPETVEQSGIGLQNLKHRAKLINANLAINSGTSGTSIIFTLNS